MLARDQASTHASTSKASAGHVNIVSYRHLLDPQPHTSSARNPLRCIAHCDIDAAYAQFQAVRLGLPPEAPVACDQWSHLLAVNYPARARGVKPFMRVWEAKEVCPELAAPHVATYRMGEDEAKFHEDAHPSTHKVSLQPFRRESAKIMSVMQLFCEEIQKVSIDEAYLDLTECVRRRILERNPHLAQLLLSAQLTDALPEPPEVASDNLGLFVPLAKTRLNAPEPTSQTTFTGHAQRWSSYALSLGAEIMKECRAEVRKQLGYTCSAGIAQNKFLAKICSGHAKPNGQTILVETAISDFLATRLIRKVPQLKRKFGKEVSEKFEAETLGDLWQYDVSRLQAKLGEKEGRWLFEAIRGRDLDEVNAKIHTASMLSRKDCLPPLRTMTEVHKITRILAIDLHSRLVEARSASPSVWPKTMAFGARTENDYRSPSRNHQARIAFSASQLSVESIWDQSKVLARGFFSLHPPTTGKPDDLGTITNVSLSFQGIEVPSKGQKSIMSFLQDGKPGPSSPSSHVAKSPNRKKRRTASSFPQFGSASYPVDLTAADNVTTVISDSEDEGRSLGDTQIISSGSESGSEAAS